MAAPFADLAAGEITHGQFVTAYDAVYELRHEFLTMADHHARGALVLDPTVVYVDGARAGGLDALKSIPASEVRCIRLAKPIDTTGALGTQLTGGAIRVETARWVRSAVCPQVRASANVQTMPTRVSIPSRLARLVMAVLASVSCAGRAMSTASDPSPSTDLEFHNETEDAVRVFVYAGNESWFVGDVQPFRWARLVLPTSLTTRHGQVISIGAVPTGGRGRDGTSTTGALVRSDTEVIDDVAHFRWTLTGHTLSAAQLPRRSREHDE
jgi:hypothetical protein